MSIPTIASSSSNQYTPIEHPPENEYTSGLPYKSISTFLNQRLTLTGKGQNQTAQFSLAEMLTHMNIKEVVLKGSSVYQWKNKTPPADIDLQCHLDASNIQVGLADQLAEFLNTHRVNPCKHHPDLQHKTWFSKIAYEADDAWSFLLLSTGHSKQKTTKIDLCYSSKHQNQYDMLSASKTIRINTEKQEATEIHKCTPALLDWMKKNHVLWFKPDINNGLGRLSYRLSKYPDAHLLQPHIAAAFCESASAETIQNIYLRVLREEYPQAQLSTNEKALLWVPVIDTLMAPTEHPALQEPFIDGIKNWSKFNDLERLKTALQNPDSAEMLVNRLQNACSIGLNFKEELSDLLLKHHEAFRTQLQPLVNKALGGKMIPAAQLFRQIGTLNQLDKIPKDELLIVFSECLQHHIEVGDDNTVQQSRNMVGWLHGDKLASCLFWLDRLPSNTRTSPSEQHATRILQSCIDLLAEQGVADSLEPVLPLLSSLKLNKTQLHTLCNSLFRCQTQGVQVNKSTPESLSLSFIQILAQHALILTDEIFHVPAQGSTSKAPIQAFYKDMMKFSARLKPQSIPPLLSQMISISNKLIRIEFPKTRLEISLTPPSLTLHTDSMHKVITDHLVGVGSKLFGPKEELNILWNDGCLFSGTVAPSTRNEQFQGAFSSPIQHPLPQGLKGLIDLPRAVCSTQWPSFDFDDHIITAKGLFHGNNLLQAKNIEEALKCLSLGEIYDESTSDNSKLYHKIMNSFPVMCGIDIEDEDTHVMSTLQIVYDRQRHGATLPEFSNAWNLSIPEHHTVRQEISSAGGGQMIFNKPWSAKTRAFNGQGEVIGEKNHRPFKWKGLIKQGKLLPKGTLWIGNNKTPALVLDSNDEQHTLPLPLIALFGTWFTGEMQGQYSFKSNIWNQREVWPPKNFEGFIAEYSTGPHHFSGYKTADGRAWGIWTNNHNVHINAKTEHPHYSLYIGSFITQQKPSRHGNAPAPLGAIQDNTEIPLTQNSALVPHGLMKQTLIDKTTYTATHAIDWMFFQGQGLSYSRINQNPEIRYDVPGTTRHFTGNGYKEQNKTKILDIVFNSEDGGADFLMVRPENFLHEPSYQTIYHDTSGLTQKILQMNNQAKMGDITFPSGIRYAGALQEKEQQFHLQGSFKIWINECKFQGVLDENPNAPIQNLKALDNNGTQALESIKMAYGVGSLTLRGLVTFISSGQLSYDSDIKPHLQVRTLTATASNSEITEFSLNK